MSLLDNNKKFNHYATQEILKLSPFCIYQNVNNFFSFSFEAQRYQHKNAKRGQYKITQRTKTNQMFVGFLLNVEKINNTTCTYRIISINNISMDGIE